MNVVVLTLLIKLSSLVLSMDHSASHGDCLVDDFLEQFGLARLFDRIYAPL
jgi:hypothetical protein